MSYVKEHSKNSGSSVKPKRYQLSRLAAAGLEDIYLFGITTFGYVPADHYIDRLVCAFEQISDHPLGMPERKEFAVPVRILPVASHLVIYTL